MAFCLDLFPLASGLSSKSERLRYKARFILSFSLSLVLQLTFMAVFNILSKNSFLCAWHLGCVLRDYISNKEDFKIYFFSSNYETRHILVILANKDFLWPLVNTLLFLNQIKCCCRWWVKPAIFSPHFLM